MPSRNYADALSNRDTAQPAHVGTLLRLPYGIRNWVDVDECGWLDGSKCMIPLQHGKVIYPKNRPAEQTNDCPMDIGNERSYKPNLKNRYQQYFLTKPICWKYEREVRVVKCISDEEWSQEHGKSSILELSNQVSVSVKKYLHAIPRSAIKEIYLGLNHPCNKGMLARK